jgi:hypothetical protein
MPSGRRDVDDRRDDRPLRGAGAEVHVVTCTLGEEVQASRVMEYGSELSSMVARYTPTRWKGRYHPLMPDSGEIRGRRRNFSHWVAPIALVVAAIALVLAIGAIIKSSNTPESKLAGDPKTRVCSAFETVSKAVPLQTNINLGDSPAAREAAAANARLALLGGGQYLLDNIDPATPEQLADAARTFATNLQEIGINALAGLENSDPDQVVEMAEGDTTRLLIADLCGVQRN